MVGAVWWSRHVARTGGATEGIFGHFVIPMHAYGLPTVSSAENRNRGAKDPPLAGTLTLKNPRDGGKVGLGFRLWVRQNPRGVELYSKHCYKDWPSTVSCYEDQIFIQS